MDYTMAGAAQTVGTSKSAIHRAIKAGRLSATKMEDGTYRIDGAELARVYPPSRAVTAEPSPWDTATRPDTATDTPSETPRDGSETAIETRIELEVLRARLEAAARERETAEAQLSQERETYRETVDDLRKRLDRAEGRLLALTSQPTAQPAPEPSPVVQEAPAVNEELRRRLEESEAHVRALVTQTAQTAQDWPSEPSVGATLAGPMRGFLGRFLGLGRVSTSGPGTA